MLERWMMGYRLPPTEDPLYEVEAGMHGILSYFFALLLVSADAPPSDPVSAVRHWLPDFPTFPIFGRPSAALKVLGIARKEGPGAELQARLLKQLPGAAAADLLLLTGEA